MSRLFLHSLLAPLVLGCFLANLPEAQFYTVGQRWRINAAGAPAPVNMYTVLDADQWAGFTPRLQVNVVNDQGFPWTGMTLAQTTGPMPLFGLMNIANGVPGCNLIANSDCANLPVNPRAGIYTATATVNPGLGAGVVTIVVGGGSPAPVVGPQVFNIGGLSNGDAFSYGLSLGDTNPAMVFVPALPVDATGAAFVAAFAASINAGAAGPFTAMALGTNLTIMYAGTGAVAFRFWVGDATGTPLCQVTGGLCQFNPTITDVTNSSAIPALPQPALVVLVVAFLSAGFFLLTRQRKTNAAPLQGQES